MSNDIKRSASLVANESSKDNISKQTLDTITSTERGILKAIYEDYFKESAFDDKSTFLAQVLKGSDTLDCVGSNDYTEMALSAITQEESIRQKCKVRIFSLHGHLTIPCTFGEYEDDLKIIELYPDTYYERKSGDLTQISAGDIVKVQFEDGNRQKPIIVYKYSSKIVDETLNAPVGSSDKRCKDRKISPRVIFKGPFSSTPANSDKSEIKQRFERYKNSGFYGKYASEIAFAVQQFPKVSAELILAVISVESEFNQYATSPTGARGLMQIILSGLPALKTLNTVSKGKTFTNALRQKFNAAFNPADKNGQAGINVSDPKQNIWIGTAVLDENLTRFSNNELRALASYNSGIAAASPTDWLEKLPTYNANGNVGEGYKYIQDVTEFKRLIAGLRTSG